MASLGSSSTWRIVFMILSFLKLNPEVGAPSQFRLEADLRPHAFNDLAHDGQADARALVRRGGVNPLQQTEDALMILRGNAYAIVPEPDSNRIVPLRFRRNLDP